VTDSRPLRCGPGFSVCSAAVLVSPKSAARRTSSVPRGVTRRAQPPRTCSDRTRRLRRVDPPDLSALVDRHPDVPDSGRYDRRVSTSLDRLDDRAARPGDPPQCVAAVVRYPDVAADHVEVTGPIPTFTVAICLRRTASMRVTEPLPVLDTQRSLPLAASHEALSPPPFPFHLRWERCWSSPGADAPGALLRITTATREDQ
jgi:hypothetical protein